MAKAAFETTTIGTELANSPQILAPWRLPSYTTKVMLYFAYGSNINLNHFTDYLDTHGVTLDTDLHGQHALLHHFRLRTNYYASTHGAGACNIESSKNECVEGVIITITPSIQDALRIKEGYPHRYEETEVIVHTAGTQEPVQAITYVVTPTHRLNVDLPVTAKYRALILNGAKHFKFSEDYQQSLNIKLQTSASLLPT